MSPFSTLVRRSGRHPHRRVRKLEGRPPIEGSSLVLGRRMHEATILHIIRATRQGLVFAVRRDRSRRRHGLLSGRADRGGALPQRCSLVGIRFPRIVAIEEVGCSAVVELARVSLRTAIGTIDGARHFLNELLAGLVIEIFDAPFCSRDTALANRKTIARDRRMVEAFAPGTRSCSSSFANFMT